MGNEIKVIILVVLALITAKVLLLLSGRNKASDTHMFILWSLLLASSALTHNIYAVLGMIILIKLFYLKNDQDKNIPAYFALWAVLSDRFFSFVWWKLPALIDISMDCAVASCIAWSGKTGAQTCHF